MLPASVERGSLNNPATTNPAAIDMFRANLNRAFAEFEAIANLEFVEVADNAETTGSIRFYISETIQGLTHGLNAGDSAILIHIQANAVHSVYVHEIGHALGLKHPYEESNDFIDATEDFPALPETRYESGLSIMTQALDPHLLQNDIDALQFLYGAPGSDFDGLQARLIDEGITPEIL